MPSTQDSIAWFKNTLGAQTLAALKDKPYSLDLLSAIAYQETGYIWGGLTDNHTPSETLAYCVGDTIDAPGRSAFPKTKAQLIAAQNGAALFQMARQALEKVAEVNADYARVAQNPNKFCHGFGIFQYDLQFGLDDPDYFLQKQWEDFSTCLAKALKELDEANRRAFGSIKSALSRDEMVYVAIAYNKGSVNLNGSFKQGYRDGSGLYYGEQIDRFMQIAGQIPNPASATAPTGPRLILAKLAPGSASQWVYQAMASAKLEEGQFQVNRSEVQAFASQDIAGPDRQAIRAMLDGANIPMIANFAHMQDPDDPRVYVFLE